MKKKARLLGMLKLVLKCQINGAYIEWRYQNFYGTPISAHATAFHEYLDTVTWYLLWPVSLYVYASCVSQASIVM